MKLSSITNTLFQIGKVAFAAGSVATGFTATVASYNGYRIRDTYSHLTATSVESRMLGLNVKPKNVPKGQRQKIWLLQNESISGYKNNPAIDNYQDFRHYEAGDIGSDVIRNVSVAVADHYDGNEASHSRDYKMMNVDFELTLDGNTWRHCRYAWFDWPQDKVRNGYNKTYKVWSLFGKPGLMMCEDLMKFLDDSRLVKSEEDGQNLNYQASNVISSILLNHYCPDPTNIDNRDGWWALSAMACMAGMTYESYSLAQITSLNFRLD